jgi:ABC-2 type transport system ATP-binding protein
VLNGASQSAIHPRAVRSNDVAIDVRRHTLSPSALGLLLSSTGKVDGDIDLRRMAASRGTWRWRSESLSPVRLLLPVTLRAHAKARRHPHRRAAFTTSLTSMTERSARLRARALTKHYGEVIALDALDLTVDAGEVYCLLGANGAGKTTTINLFLNFVPPTSGEAQVCGIDVTRDPLEAKRHIAYIPETVMLYRSLTALENLEYFAGLATDSPPAREVLIGHLREVGLRDDQIHQRVGGFSKGMRQKVGIAVALAKHAEVLLLDEPTSGLDPKASNEFSALITRLRAQGAAILMATHDLFRAKESGTRVGIMKRGRLVAELATADIGHADLEQLYLTHMHD